jgi:hypothetical protein
VVEVVDHPHRDAAHRCVHEPTADGLVLDGAEFDVVHGDVERPLGRVQEVGERLSDLLGRLAAVRQRAELDQLRCAFNDALWARFAAW